MIDGGRGQSVILDLHRLAAQGTRQDRRDLTGFRRCHPGGEDIEGENGVVEHDRSRSNGEFSRPLHGAGHEPDGEPAASELTEDTRGLPGIGDVILQCRGHGVAVYFENGCEHDDRTRTIVADGGGETPAGVAARQPAVAQPEGLTGHFQRIYPNGEHPFIDGGARLEDCQDEQGGHAATVPPPKTRVAMRS